MTNKQAAKLLPGHRIRRKNDDTGTIYVVERIERIIRYSIRDGVDVRVYAGSEVFMAWEIQRCDPLQGWPSQ